MIKCFKKAISSVLAATMLATSFTAMPINTFAATSFSTAGGWFETLYAEWSGNKSDVTGVSYSGTASGSLTGDDLTYLVRQDGSNVRLDIPGLKAGTYNLTVTTKDGSITKENIKVYAYDRSGYAHYDAHKEGVTGVGAYNDDGTLKSNAIVVYVTDENKNTVQVPGYTGDEYPKGIGNILNYKSTDANGVTGGSKVDLVKQFREEGIPLDIRFVGSVVAGDSNTRNNPPAENINGLTVYNQAVNGGSKGDNGMMARVYKGSNITFEGIGTDATLDGWGIQIVSQTSYISQGFEFRNLNFVSTPEDAIGLEGTCAISNSPQTKEWFEQNGYSPIKFCWVHNNTFQQGYCKNPAESDKAEGDGSCDWKRGYGYTNSYNHYVQNHKTNLVGSSKSSIQYDATFHHNYYDTVMSRQPLARQANIHIYNSYFKGATSYVMSPRAYSYIFSEGNFFDNCKNPVDSPAEGGNPLVKSYNDNFSGCSGTNAATIVSSKDQKVTSSNPYAGFEYGSDMYEYTATDSAQAKADCLNLAGVMKAASEINMEPTPDRVITDNPDALALPYEINFTDPTNTNYWATKTSETSLTAGKQYNMGNALVTPYAKSSNTATTMKIRDNGIVFKVNTGANVTIKAGASSTYGIQLINEYGVGELTVSAGQTATATNLPAGTYVINSGNTAKDAYIDNVKVVAYDPDAPTVTEATTETTTKASTGGDDTTETTTASTPVVDDGYSWHYDGVDASGNDVSAATSSIFDIDGNDTTNDYAYNGVTYNRGIKMESSTNITVNAPADGALKLVVSTGGATKTIKIDGTAEDVTDGLNVFDLTAGTHTIAKGTTGVYVYVMSYAVAGGDDTTTTTTEATTETTTKETTTKATEATTKEATETTTAAPVDGVKVVVGDATVKNGSAVTVPVKLTGMTDLADYNITLTYDSAALTATKVENGDIINDSMATINSNITDGSVRIAGINPADTINTNGTVLVNVTFTANKEGTTPVTITVNTLKGANLAVANYTTSNGTVTVTANGGSVETSTETTTTETESTTEATTVDYSAKGDVNKDGKIDEKDAALILKFIQGIKDETFYDEAAADANGDGVINALDATWVLNHKGNTSKPEASTSTETTTETTTATETTTEEATETTTVAPTGDSVAAGTYSWNDTSIVGTKKGTFNNMTYSSANNVTTAGIKLKSSDYVTFKVAENSKMTATFTGGSGLVITDGVNETTLTSGESVALTAGVTYTIKGAGTSNTTLSQIVFVANGSSSEDDTTKATTTTETTTETTTTTTTETTTKATTTTEATTTTTTEATTTTTTEATTESTTVTPAGDIVATINASDLTAGDITANTVSGQFKLIADATNKLTIEANSKSLDGYEFTQRLKTNGTGAIDKRAISFTTTGAGNVIFYAISGSNKEDRPVNLLDATGATVGTVTVSGTTFAKYTIAIPSAGTYYLVSGKSGINFYLIGTDVALADQSADATTETTTATETSTEATTATTTTETTTKATTTTEATTTTTTEATTTTTTEATTESTTVTPAGDIVATINASDLTAGDITANTVSGQFKLIADATNKLTIEANSKSLDGYEFTQRLKTNGTGAIDKRAISFTTTGAGNVIFYAISGSNKEDRPVNLLDATGATVGTVTVSGTTFAKYTIAIPSAGTYYLVSGKSGINFYLIGTDVALADQSADATTVTTTTTETSTEATTATTTTKADDTTETTTAAPADKAFAVSGDSWSAENDSVPTWLNGGKLTTAKNSYTAFAAESANGTAFTKVASVAADSSITIDVADALTASVFIAGNNNTANKGTIKATFTDESGNVTDITPENANLDSRKTATTAFELVATGKGTITVTPDYNSLLYKVAVK